MICKRCNVPMEIGKAIKYKGREKGERGIHCIANPIISADMLQMIDCWKCPKCGHSEDLSKS